jgi:hypothetical protein
MTEFFFDPQLIRASDPLQFWLFTALAWGLALAGIVGLIHFLRRLRFIEDTPQSVIRSAAQGYVELQGSCKLMPGTPIVAPLTHQPCVWWHYRIEQHVGSGKNRHWQTLRNEVSGELFLIEDETGACVVDPDKAEVYPSQNQTWYGNSPMPEGGPGMGIMSIGAQYRYVERRMEHGDPLYALGFFHTQGPVTAGDIDAEVRQQLLEWKRDQAWLKQHFDTNHDGQVDSQEWEAARQEARRLVLEQEREAMARPPVSMLSQPRDDRPFILSTLPQKRLETRLKLSLAVCLLLFFGAGIYGTYRLDARFSSQPPGAAATP